ncbi:MAG TPA: flagellar biosynthesis protein FlhB [Burkholderiales bacterium]|nr:flagellar biosynthesis protein FlhB [Burkholderiales bacterium]
MAADSDQEKTLPATPRRLEQAREEGQVARSRELGACAVLAAGAAIAWGGGSIAMNFCTRLMRDGLSIDRASAFADTAPGSRLLSLSLESTLAALPLFGFVAAVAVFSGVALSGWLFSSKAVTPDFTRLNPLKGLGRIFSVEGLTELFKAISKALLVGSLGGLYLWFHREELLSLSSLAPGQSLAATGGMIQGALIVLAAALALIAMIDVPIVLWRHHKGLRMSLEEVKREMRESEGDPHLKAHIRSQQREAARKRMMAEVPKADVVVTNPTHFAVALAYQEGKFGAPRVVAKGRGEVALRIRALAAEHKVALLEAPPLARALYVSTELGDEIPAALYNTVARVLAYIYQLRHYSNYGGMQPQMPTELEVPEGMDPGSPDQGERDDNGEDN